jgi:alcohol dehydrogenase (cytochrome c)
VIVIRQSAARRAGLVCVSGLALAAGLAPSVSAQPGPPVFTDAQAQAGAAIYAAQCAACHGAEAQGSSIGPSLKGAEFLGKWGGVPLDRLFAYMRSSMPPGAAGAVDDGTYAGALAFLMRENGAAAGDRALPADTVQLAAMTAPLPPPVRSGAFLGIAGLGSSDAAPGAVDIPDRLAGLTSVTDRMLADPPPVDWLSWRRSHSAQGWSPLDQITTQNARDLQVAWSQALPTGPNMNEPLVHDGVMFVHAYGDEVWALDGATGRVLWRYQRHAAEGAPRASKKTMALYGDRLFVATADVHMVALDVRTGLPVWDTPVTGAGAMRIPGGPIVAEGVVMTGVATQAAGGAIIAGFDAATGEQIWTFNTVAQPDQPGGDTWNGLSAEERSGGSSWTSGSYDPGTGLSYWGAAGTYDTAPLRLRSEGENNDGLYTNATLALDPATGRLVWFYQHMPNDQWDLDWVFERTIADIQVGGETRRVVMTAGKPSLFDILDAATGEYLGSVDMGLQNFITAIDPETGAKTYDPALIPAGGNDDIVVCPNGGGGRNWPPTAFNPVTRTMFAGARDVCMHMVPLEGGGGLLTTGVTLTSIPSERSAQDGMQGIIQALDMETGEIAWEVRQRSPLATGFLVTAGGVAFAGGTDRRFHAYDQANGDVLWSEGLIDGPSGAPITYAVDGRQYVAVVVGHGNPLSGSATTPEIPPAPIGAAAVIVYALPE